MMECCAVAACIVLAAIIGAVGVMCVIVVVSVFLDVRDAIRLACKRYTGDDHVSR